MPQRMVLSDLTLRKLIKEVRRRECLWNPHHDRYNDRYQMAKAWMEVANLLQLPEERLRVKWKNLRDLFKKEIKKFGANDQYTGKWRHFELLTFLNINTDNSIKDNSTVLNKTNENEETLVEAKIEIDDDDDEEFEYELEEQETEQNNDEEVYLDESYEEDPIPDKIAKLSTDAEDYDVMFLKSLAPYFRQLDPIRKLVVRTKMQDMLLNELAAQSSSNQVNSKKS